MKQSPFLEFESSAFAVIPGEDEETNPGIYGKASRNGYARSFALQAFPLEMRSPKISAGWCRFNRSLIACTLRARAVITPSNGGFSHLPREECLLDLWEKIGGRSF